MTFHGFFLFETFSLLLSFAFYLHYFYFVSTYESYILSFINIFNPHYQSIWQKVPGIWKLDKIWSILDSLRQAWGYNIPCIFTVLSCFVLTKFLEDILNGCKILVILSLNFLKTLSHCCLHLYVAIENSDAKLFFFLL